MFNKTYTLIGGEGPGSLDTNHVSNMIRVERRHIITCKIR